MYSLYLCCVLTESMKDLLVTEYNNVFFFFFSSTPVLKYVYT